MYLGDAPDTTIYELRAGVYDYVSVGKFVLKEDIIIADLKMKNQISPLIDGLDCKENALYKEHLYKSNDELGKVMRCSDGILDYVPTQYITDFIKSAERAGKNEDTGIGYKSVMHVGGYNIAIFEPELFECIGTDIYKIDTEDYRKKIL